MINYKRSFTKDCVEVFDFSKTISQNIRFGEENFVQILESSFLQVEADAEIFTVWHALQISSVFTSQLNYKTKFYNKFAKF